MLALTINQLSILMDIYRDDFDNKRSPLVNRDLTTLLNLGLIEPLLGSFKITDKGAKRVKQALG